MEEFRGFVMSEFLNSLFYFIHDIMKIFSLEIVTFRFDSERYCIMNLLSIELHLNKRGALFLLILNNLVNLIN